MGRETRKSLRRYVHQGARLVSAAGADLGTCVLHDISGHGARIEPNQPQDIPDFFVLLLSHDGRLRRQCSVVWRAKGTVGVEFIRDFPKSP